MGKRIPKIRVPLFFPFFFFLFFHEEKVASVVAMVKKIGIYWALIKKMFFTGGKKKKQKAPKNFLGILVVFLGFCGKTRGFVIFPLLKIFQLMPMFNREKGFLIGESVQKAPKKIFLKI